MSTTADETRDRLDFVDAMAGDAVEALSRLHEGVRQVVFTDFPDHHNIGDAAIALGQLAFWRRAGIEVVMTYSWRTIGDGVFGSAIPVAIQGGGNVGGLYPVHGEHRFALAERLDPATLLIQEPQTIHFVTDADRESFATRLASREAFRLAVRDRPSLDAVRDLMPSAILSPDSAHVLGRLAAPAPTRAAVFLLRRDGESALHGDGLRPRTPHAVDWPELGFGDLARRRVARIVREGQLRRTDNRRTSNWERDARLRVERGVRLLSPGETIVTDRLHAMLLALQMGRRVIAIDNANGKLTSYARTWFADGRAPVVFAEDLAHAAELLRTGRP
ncbi:polysaccharide pyruvyl transferase family protein [Microbacterium sp.]|uniref:polysaccharide pyruvyl transferase family protein n=2 Tax=unclassified Microbacterium TaxID=2609290 RepID=UPI001AD52FF7|nr:polysaccharide pyruvyl transferase family protein [Microbacterium sp.]MBN9184336.1 polysaccharide pyruvyl transferase family protein [Microbacterium sp.]MBN9187541.1 polysaccharide pyruvyl transferase family protein [Microbacterium sp.]MBN9191797.1 polysaccharide pyruvyl transferase family protein [Microbacterium sp.]